MKGDSTGGKRQVADSRRQTNSARESGPSSEQNLLACPFCGGECAYGTTKYSESTQRSLGLEQRVWHFVNCIVCGVSNAGITGGYKTIEQAAAKWNARNDCWPSGRKGKERKGNDED